jgi:hypothetical protein
MCVASQRDAIADETATAPTGRRAVSEPRFLLSLRGAAMAHALSASTDVVAREGRPGRHAPAAGNLTATPDDESYHGSASELPPTTSHGYANWDFSGVPDPVMFQWFLDVVDYWFVYSNNSSTESYDLMRECCVVLANDQANTANAAEAGDGEVPPDPGTGPHQARGKRASPLTAEGCRHQRAAGPSVRARSQTREEYRAVRLLCASIVGEASVRGERARELSKQARERINTDFDVNNPNTPSRASQKLITAATLLRVMPAPSTPEAWNLHREAQALIEQVAVQQAESSVSRIR